MISYGRMASRRFRAMLAEAAHKERNRSPRPAQIVLALTLAAGALVLLASAAERLVAASGTPFN